MKEVGLLAVCIRQRKNFRAGGMIPGISLGGHDNAQGMTGGQADRVLIQRFNGAGVKEGDDILVN
jgi:hypothetical protein